MASNPILLSFVLYILVVSALFVFMRLNAKNKASNSSVEISNNKSKIKLDKQSKSDDKYHVGGLKTEHFILLLMDYDSLTLYGHSYEDLKNKKTQTNYDAFQLFDALWRIFGHFNEILSLDYMNSNESIGEWRRNGIKVTYDKDYDFMRIKVHDMMLEGSLADFESFKNNAESNHDILDIRTASTKMSDYLGILEHK
ncbi:hypothetical protein [Staphylococcus aureus]|uniref:hypothetical protein n=1 Tax=Staphylococcus aureus TaxID=1280 RepID=UPI001BFD63B6|nr:hypothetical protein [Staphylococcus aureus]MBZ5280835.1 hypothetical protein [Staphylococcus aureus]